MVNEKAEPKISEELMALLVKKAFSCLPTSIREVEQARSNKVYVITLENGRKVVMKVSPFDDERVMHHEKNKMYTEVTVLQKMKNYTTIEVPEVYYYDASHTELNASYFFMEHMTGDNYRDVREALSKQAQATIDEEMGRNNRVINDIVGSHFGYFGRRKRQRDTWFESFTDMIKDILDDAKYYNVQIPYDPDMINRLLAEAKPVFDEVTEPRLVHCDFWDGNVFIQNGRVQGIVDWERCIWGDPLMELAFKPNHQRDAFFRGYGFRELTEHEKYRIKWYSIYTSMAYLVEYNARGQEDPMTFNKIWKWLTDSFETLHD